MNKTDLELFKEILKDDSLHFTVAMVDRVTPAKDRTSVALECTDIVHGNELVCVMTWDSVGADCGSGDLPDPEDLYLVAFSNGNINSAFAMKRLASKDEKLPKQLIDGHYVTKAKPGKKLFLGSDTQVQIGRADPDHPCTEPLVLGLVLTVMLGNMIDKIKDALNAVVSGPVGIGNLGAPVPTFPALIASLNPIIADLTTLKTTFLVTPATNIVAQKAFTERGT